MTCANYCDSPSRPVIILVTNQTRPEGSIKCQIYTCTLASYRAYTCSLPLFQCLKLFILNPLKYLPFKDKYFTLFTFVSSTYRFIAHVSDSALSSSMAVQHRMQRSDFKLRSMEVLEFGHGSDHCIHILHSEMKEELVWFFLDCQNFCNSLKEKHFQIWQPACDYACLYLFPMHAVLCLCVMEGERNCIFPVTFLDSCIFSLETVVSWVLESWHQVSHLLYPLLLGVEDYQ